MAQKEFAPSDHEKSDIQLRQIFKVRIRVNEIKYERIYHYQLKKIVRTLLRFPTLKSFPVIPSCYSKHDTSSLYNFFGRQERHSHFFKFSFRYCLYS